MILFKKEKKSKIIIKSSPRGSDADFPKIESSDLTQSMKEKLSSIYIFFWLNVTLNGLTRRHSREDQEPRRCYRNYFIEIMLDRRTLFYFSVFTRLFTVD